MKKIIFFALFISQFCFSQIAMTRSTTGAAIPSGTVLASNVLNLPSEIGFKVRNIGSTTTNVWVRCQNLVNNDGSQFQLCFGEECLEGMVVGNVYPSVGVTLAPNGTNGNFDHFLNNNPGTAVYPLDFVFKFFQTNQATQGGAEISNAVIVTYRYDPALSADEINQLQTSGVIVKSTVIENELILDVLKSTTMYIYDLNGKLVYNSNLNYGIQTIDVSDLSSGVYVINFTNIEGDTTSKKVIKK
jgi:hypothetical protein